MDESDTQSAEARQQRQLEAIRWIAESGVLDDLNDPDVRAAARR